MNHQLIHQAQLTQILRDRIDSREWWVFLPVDMEGVQILRKIEQRFYWDDAGSDFDLAILPQFKFSVAFGRKARLPKRKLIKLLNKEGALPFTFDDQDILMLSVNNADGMRALAFLSTLYDRHYPEMN